MLYGHLNSINVWVGKEVIGGETIGILGLNNERHLHLEIHSYGSTTTGFYGNQIHSSGILPVGGNGTADVAPYIYDIMQFLPNPAGLTGNLSSLVATANLTSTPGGDSATLSFTSGCNLTYLTYLTNPGTGMSLKETAGFRGTHEFTNAALVSPLTVTTPPQ